MLTIPNLLTFSRIVLIPFLVVAYFLPWKSAHLLAMIVFVVAGLTDLFDGWLARRWNQTSSFGAFLDPVADKLIVATALVLLATDETVIGAVIDRQWFAIVCTIIIGREIVVSGLREWMAEIGQRASVAVSYVGKFKTVLQITAISMLLFRQDILGFPIFKIGEFLLYVAAFMTLWSMGVYLRAATPALLSTANTARPPEPESDPAQPDTEVDTAHGSATIHELGRE